MCLLSYICGSWSRKIGSLVRCCVYIMLYKFKVRHGSEGVAATETQLPRPYHLQL